MKIKEIKIKNYKVLKDVTLSNLSNMAVFLGANGSGKSTIFDVFSFIYDSLNTNVTKALNKRGGFEKVISQGQQGPIEFEITYFLPNNNPSYTYNLKIDIGQDNYPYIEHESLRHSESYLLKFSRGEGNVVAEIAKKHHARLFHKNETLESSDILAIKGFGQFQQYSSISRLRRMIEDWHIFDLDIYQAKKSYSGGYSKYLSSTGDNLASVTRYIYKKDPESFKNILHKMAKRVPGVDKVEAIETPDNRIILRFQDGSFKDPFNAEHVSDGTIKMFAYLLLLNEPETHSLLCMEEPENHLHHKLMYELSEEFREYTKQGGQVFINTHSPQFVNGLELSEIFWLEKKDGFTRVHHGSDDELLQSLVEAGDMPGALWRQGLMKGAGPR